MVLPVPRPAIDAVPAYRPGRPAPSDAFKLSSNENPFGPLPSVAEAAAAELRRMNRYPDAGMTRLYAALEQASGVESHRFAAGTGSVAVLYGLLSAYCSPGDEVVYAWRSFEAYPIAVELSGASSVRVPLLADGTHDLDAMAAAVTSSTKVVLVCTPNNPTGPVVRHDDLLRFVDEVPEHVVVVVDEAYLEFVRDPDAARGLELVLADRPNVIVLRTFSKAYGLAGLRVGYLCGPAAIAEAVRKTTPPFSVTDVAQAAAVASLAAVDELAERVDAVVAERTSMLAALRAQGWSVPDSQANFVWLDLGDDALDFAAAVEPISVRAFAGEGVRVTVGDPEVNARLVEGAARWITGR